MPKNHAKNQEQESEVLDFTKPDYEFVPKGYHEWRQQGPYLTCFSCELKHSVYIGTDRILTGFDAGGRPILKIRRLSSR